jgi:hypothetical protein
MSSLNQRGFQVFTQLTTWLQTLCCHQVSEKLENWLVGEGGVNAQSAQFLLHQYAPMILHIVVSANPITALLSATTCVSHHHGESQILQKFTSKF